MTDVELHRLLLQRRRTASLGRGIHVLLAWLVLSACVAVPLPDGWRQDAPKPSPATTSQRAGDRKIALTPTRSLVRARQVTQQRDGTAPSQFGAATRPEFPLSLEPVVLLDTRRPALYAPAPGIPSIQPRAPPASV